VSGRVTHDQTRPFHSTPWSQRICQWLPGREPSLTSGSAEAVSGLRREASYSSTLRRRHCQVMSINNTEDLPLQLYMLSFYLFILRQLHDGDDCHSRDAHVSTTGHWPLITPSSTHPLEPKATHTTICSQQFFYRTCHTIYDTNHITFHRTRPCHSLLHVSRHAPCLAPGVGSGDCGVRHDRAAMEGAARHRLAEQHAWRQHVRG
jgi:hypothetical protein